jgi:CheY-like chemotaxis protein
MKTITILLIEDNTQDIRLIKEMLKEIRSFSYNLETAATLKEGCEQIQKNNFDIILLDLNLPDSAGQQTFQKVIDCCKEIPVVLVTGNEDQELSVKLIMEGAQDYITKQSLNSTPLEKSILYSIERQALLRNIKNQNAQIDRIEKELMLLAKFPSENPGPILRIAENGKLLYINEAGIKLLPDWQLIINEIIPFRLKDIIDTVFIEGTNIEFELAHREFIYSFYAVLFIKDGYINLYGRDITERKRAEIELCESERRMNFHVNNSPLATIEWNTDLVVTRWSDGAEKIFGWNQSETIGKPIMDFPIIYEHFGF